MRTAGTAVSPTDAVSGADNDLAGRVTPACTRSAAGPIMKSWLRRRPLLAFFTLAFGISWGGILIIAAAIGFDIAAPTTPLATVLFFVAMLLGPSVSGLMLTALMEGRAGLGDLRARLRRWRVGASWCAVALLTAPMLLLAILLLLSATIAPAFAPKFQWALLVVGLIAGAFEEIGWTGFATPRLLARRSAATAGFQFGVIWALWHALVVFLFTVGEMGDAWIVSFIVVYLATLTPYRIVMTWVYANTQSVLLAILMHASYTGWLLALFPATSSTQSLIWQAAFAGSLWLAAAFALRNTAHGEHRRPLLPFELQQKETTR